MQAFPRLDRKWLISTDGGTEPRWSRNGRELFYRNGDKLMAVDVNTQPAFSAGSPRVLFQGRGLPVAGGVQGFAVFLAARRDLTQENCKVHPP